MSGFYGTAFKNVAPFAQAQRSARFLGVTVTLRAASEALGPVGAAAAADGSAAS